MLTQLSCASVFPSHVWLFLVYPPRPPLLDGCVVFLYSPISHNFPPTLLLSCHLFSTLLPAPLPCRPTSPTPLVSLFHIHIQRCRQGIKRCAWARRASRPKTSRSFRLWSRRQWLPFCKRLFATLENLYSSGAQAAARCSRRAQNLNLNSNSGWS